MKKTNIWKPDTCNCVITYEWDTEDTNINREHTVIHTEPCEFHKDQSKEVVFETVKDENTRKNKFIADVMENVPEIVEIDVKGQKKLKEDVVVDFHFDEERNLNINIPSLKSLDELALKNLAETKYGVNKVKLNNTKEEILVSSEETIK